VQAVSLTIDMYRRKILGELQHVLYCFHLSIFDKLSRFRANPSLFLLLNAVCLVEKQQIPILVFGLTLSGLEPTIYRIRGEHVNHYTTDAVVARYLRWEGHASRPNQRTYSYFCYSYYIKSILCPVI
jgi:hypothetical protein